MDALSVAVERGGALESVHRVHAVVVRDGRVERVWGDPGRVTFVRSAAKPLQALGLAREAPELPSEELAIVCASHEALPRQLAAVEALLDRAGASEGDLECGPIGGSRIRHNCSGKHAGMLLRCRLRGWDAPGYRLAEHSLQRVLVPEVAACAGLEPADVVTGIDGCGVVAYAVPLAAAAETFTRLIGRELDGADSVVAAMTAHPDLVGGPSADDTAVMQMIPGAVAKRGAEGVLCAGLPDGSAFAIKVEDGAHRVVAPVARLLSGAESGEPVRNSRGDEVGRIVLIGS